MSLRVLSIFLVATLWSSVCFGYEGKKAVILPPGVDLRSRPMKSAETIVCIESGDVVEIVNRLERKDELFGARDRWYLVRYHGLEGWIFGLFIDIDGKNATKHFVEISPFSERINTLLVEEESKNDEAVIEIASSILSDIDANFSKETIRGSKILKEYIFTSLFASGKAYTFLGKYDDAKKTFKYLSSSYPEIEMELETVVTAKAVEPYLVYIDSVSNAIFYESPEDCVRAIESALKKKDLKRLSNLAVPGIFEIVIAHTDWATKVGKASLIDNSWFVTGWRGKWEVTSANMEYGPGDETVIGCVETKSWDIQYYGQMIERVDFCVEKIADEGCCLSYMVLYISPQQ